MPPGRLPPLSLPPPPPHADSAKTKAKAALCARYVAVRLRICSSLISCGVSPDPVNEATPNTPAFPFKGESHLTMKRINPVAHSNIRCIEARRWMQSSAQIASLYL